MYEYLYSDTPPGVIVPESESTGGVNLLACCGGGLMKRKKDCMWNLVLNKLPVCTDDKAAGWVISASVFVTS